VILANISAYTWKTTNDLEQSYQSDTNLVKDEHDLFEILQYFEWVQNYFCQLLNVRGVNDVRQTELHADEIPGLSSSETAIEKTERHKLHVFIKF
jgi:hypothetical protein